MLSPQERQIARLSEWKGIGAVPNPGTACRKRVALISTLLLSCVAGSRPHPANVLLPFSTQSLSQYHYS